MDHQQQRMREIYEDKARGTAQGGLRIGGREQEGGLRSGGLRSGGNEFKDLDKNSLTYRRAKQAEYQKTYRAKQKGVIAEGKYKDDIIVQLEEEVDSLRVELSRLRVR